MRQKIVFIAIFIIFILGLSAGGVWAYQRHYQNLVYPGVYVGPFSLGGMSREEVKNFAENFNNRLSKEGLRLAVLGSDGVTHTVRFPAIVEGDAGVELVRIDSDALAEGAAQAVHSLGWRGLISPLWARFVHPVRLIAPSRINTSSTREVLADLLAPYQTMPNDAHFEFPDKRNLLNYKIIAEKPGTVIGLDKLITELSDQLGVLSFEALPAVAASVTPAVRADDIVNTQGALPGIIGLGDIELNFTSPDTNQRVDWRVRPAQFVDWLEVKQNNGQDVLGLRQSAVLSYLDTVIRPQVETPAQNAKFVMIDGKVKEFTGSNHGIALNADQSYRDLDAAFQARSSPVLSGQNLASARPPAVAVSFEITEPDVTTANVNTLGIASVVGAGTSTFFGSHPNRIKNIATAVKRLNGVLIKPGETFSANRFAGPYITANGFLPELVIKGNQIKKEVGGGMCQIGTTLFRMAMNAGMDITERHNHSLVVNYYSDPVNGNPGTDATLYDPSLDLKFLNDTGGYLLLQTAINYKTMLLTFTLWGTPDGRQGWYSHPTVSKWLAPGKEVQTFDTKGTLAPGAKECQTAYRGAVASFTYSRVTPGGEKIDRVFDSYYRPLSKICLLGAAASSTPLFGLSGAVGEPIE